MEAKKESMKLIDRTKKLIITAFLLSLLFHASSILYFLWQGTDKQKTQSLQEKEDELKQEIKKREEWVETKARQNNFGAPVMFQDVPNEEEQPEQEEVPTPEVQPVTETVPEKVTPEEKNVSFQELTQQTAAPSPKKPPIEKKAAPQKKPSQTTPRPTRQPATKKPPLSLAQLTQGFLNHVKDEGTHAIHMLGKKTGIPSDEQIKHERYLQKISWCLQNSFNINNDRFPASSNTQADVHIQLALNRDGTMKHCNVAKTSGNIHLDKFTLFVFNDASTSFPPVPQYLPYDPFTVTYIISLNTTEQNSFRMYRR